MAASRKLYREVASRLKITLKYAYSKAAVAEAIRDVAGAFKADNSNFRYDYFYAACGLDSFGEVIKEEATA